MRTIAAVLLVLMGACVMSSSVAAYKFCRVDADTVSAKSELKQDR